MVTIRPATAADTPRLLEMAAAFLEHTSYGALVRFNPAALQLLIAQVLVLGVILVAEDADRLDGMLAIIELTDPLTGDRYADEQVWWVEPHARSRAVGPRLLKVAESWAKSRNLSIIKMVAPTGTHVGSFYQRVGYTPIETAYTKRLR